MTMLSDRSEEVVALLRRKDVIAGDDNAAVDRFLRALALLPNREADSPAFSPEERELMGLRGEAFAPTVAASLPAAATLVALGELLATALTIEDAARALHLDPRAVEDAVARRRLYAIAGAEPLLPRFQFIRSTGGTLAPVPASDTVFARVDPARHPLAVEAWFARVPQPELVLAGRESTPREWLLAGGDPAAVRVPEPFRG
jgi:hypothetical protein